MGIFRPARRVTAPDGAEWEIYVQRYRQPRWDPRLRDGIEDDYPQPLLYVLTLPLRLFDELVLPLWRFLVDLPFAWARGRRARTVWIEAVSWEVPPVHESIRWTTTLEHAERVLDQIASGLRRGDVARPLGASYVGRTGRR